MTSPTSKTWFVYILLCEDGSLYTGITTDLNKRLRTHQAGTGAKYTRGRNPQKIVYSETCPDRSSATKREMEIKKLPREGKVNLIELNLK